MAINCMKRRCVEWTKRRACCVSVPVPSAPVEPDAAAKGVGRMQMGPARPNHVVDAERLPPELGLPTAAGLVCSTSCRHRAWGSSARRQNRSRARVSDDSSKRSRAAGTGGGDRKGGEASNERENCARKARTPLCGGRLADLRSAALLVTPLAWRAPSANLLGAVRG